MSSRKSVSTSTKAFDVAASPTTSWSTARVYRSVHKAASSVCARRRMFVAATLVTSVPIVPSNVNAMDTARVRRPTISNSAWRATTTRPESTATDVARCLWATRAMVVRVNRASIIAIDTRTIVSASTSASSIRPKHFCSMCPRRGFATRPRRERCAPTAATTPKDLDAMCAARDTFG